jgi:predicted amidophosphoribosyltransferase
MSDTPLLSTKKCPHCQQWSPWQQRPADRCAHCGELLDPQAHQSDLAREETAQQKMPSVLLVEIKPEDGAVMRFFKTIVRGGQLAFAAILGFIVWVVTVLVG